MFWPSTARTPKLRNGMFIFWQPAGNLSYLGKQSESRENAFVSPLACLSCVYFSRYPPNGELARRLIFWRGWLWASKKKSCIKTTEWALTEWNQEKQNKTKKRTELDWFPVLSVLNEITQGLALVLWKIYIDCNSPISVDFQCAQLKPPDLN